MPPVAPCSLTAHRVASRRLRAGELIRQSARRTPRGLSFGRVRVGWESKPNTFGITGLPGLRGMARARPAKKNARSQGPPDGPWLRALFSFLRLGLGVLDLFGFLDHFGFRGDLLDDLLDDFGLVLRLVLDRPREVDREVAALDVARGCRRGLLSGLGGEHRVERGVARLDLGLDVDRGARLV